MQTRRLPANRPPGPSRPLSVWAWLVFAVFAAFALREFSFLVYRNGDQLAIGSPNNLGDVSLHMHLARYFANGARWWPEHPEISGQPMRYYPGVDLFQSLLLLVGANDLRALAWVGLIGAAATAVALYRWGGSSRWPGFLFSGGLAGFQFFNHFVISDYQAELGWKNLPLAIFVTQRPFLYALPAGLLLLIHWREKFFGDPPATAATVRPGDDDRNRSRCPRPCRMARSRRGCCRFGWKCCSTRRCRCFTCSRSCSPRCCWDGGSSCIFRARRCAGISRGWSASRWCPRRCRSR